MATFYNQATLSFNGGAVSSNVASGEILETLSVAKTAVVDTYTTGSDVTYAVNILNAGSAALTGLTLTDDLGAYTFNTQTLVPLTYVDGSVKVFVNGVLQPAPTVTAGPPLVISALSVPAGGETTVLYTARTNSFASPETTGTIENTATVSAAGLTDAAASAVITAQAAPRLEIIKSVSPNVVTENDPITYTFEIRNHGNTAALDTDSLVLNDTFDPVLTDLRVEYNGSAWTSPDDYAYDAVTGVFTTETGAITVPAAVFTQDAATGAWSIEPGVTMLTVTGTI